MTIKILNYKAEPSGKEAGYCIMRGFSLLANPFAVKPWGPYNRGETIPLYEEWLRRQIAENNIPIKMELSKLYKHWKEFNELNLVCCCAPAPCHGDIIKKVLIEKSDGARKQMSLSAEEHKEKLWKIFKLGMSYQKSYFNETYEFHKMEMNDIAKEAESLIDEVVKEFDW